VWELSYGRTVAVVPIGGVPVPVGGEVGLIWGPGWTATDANPGAILRVTPGS